MRFVQWHRVADLIRLILEDGWDWLPCGRLSLYSLISKQKNLIYEVVFNHAICVRLKAPPFDKGRGQRGGNVDISTPKVFCKGEGLTSLYSASASRRSSFPSARRGGPMDDL